MIFNIFEFVILLLGMCAHFSISNPEKAEGVKYANKCEVCKILAYELQNRLEETGKSSDVIEIGYAVDDIKPKKRTEYKKSELRLIESLDGICDKILEYNIHKERSDSSRFARGMSETFKTLHGLVDKGVKVDLGIPYELWDKPSAEITNMKSQCETVLENNEEDIENWYYKLQGQIPLKTYLCTERVLKGDDDTCLSEDFVPPPKSKGESGDKPNKQAIDSKRNDEL
uniref:DUF3456 domain-containing protein n=1 Tax=Clastoptera arizonana TaxID=38151 RepID=A0A1B6EA76_9HEMI